MTGQSDDAFEPTIVIPVPGGRRSRSSAGQFTAEPAAPSGAEAEIRAKSINPMVEAAASALNLAVLLKETPKLEDVEGLRQRMIGLISRFEQAVRNRSADTGALKVGHYALCAFVDDVVLSTPWGRHSDWSRQGMVATFHGDVTGGDRFYEVLTQIQRQPAHFGEALELMYLCLSLGFEGRLRVEEQGPAEHVHIRDRLYRTVRSQRGEFERELSPHWQGIKARQRPIISYVPVWVIGVFAAVFLTLLYTSFSFTLAGLSEDAAAKLARLPPSQATQVATMPMPAPVIDVKVEPPVQLPPVPPVIIAPPFNKEISEILDKELRDQLVLIKRHTNSLKIIFLGDGMFDSGKANVDPRYTAKLQKIAQLLARQPVEYPVTVVGHTDSTPIRTARFPSNQVLSEARAQAVADLMIPYLSKPTLVSTVGYGDRQPITGNDFADAKARNRRVELFISTVAAQDQGWRTEVKETNR